MISNRKKQNFIDSLRKNAGNIQKSCKEVGINRQTYYNIYKSDELFRNEVDIIDEETIDFVEDALIDMIRDKNLKAITFYLKYRARRRGYTNSLDITSGGEPITEIKLIQIDSKEDLDRLNGN